MFLILNAIPDGKSSLLSQLSNGCLVWANLKMVS